MRPGSCRRGITPVVAIALLLGMTVAASGGAYTWISQVQEGVQDEADRSLAAEAEVVDARCEAGGGVVAFTLDNDGSTQLDANGMDVYAYNVSTGNLVASETLDLDTISPGNLVSDNTTLDTAFRRGQEYRVEFAFDDVSAETTCQAAKRCPDGFAPVHGAGGFCIMTYEASHADATDTTEGSSATPTSQQGVVPWTGINQSMAAETCGDAGYYLPNNTEWQAATGAVSGEPSTFVHGNDRGGQSDDNLSETCTDDPTLSGFPRCLTGTGPHETWCTDAGVCDLNGNVLEWTDAFYGDGSVCDSDSFDSDGDDSGKVVAWNAQAACPAEINSTGSADFGGDGYVPPEDGTGDGAVLRGGSWVYWESGPWYMNLNHPPSRSAGDTGFRCAAEGTVG